jgi:hypothetical protein
MYRTSELSEQIKQSRWKKPLTLPVTGLALPPLGAADAFDELLEFLLPLFPAITPITIRTPTPSKTHRTTCRFFFGTAGGGGADGITAAGGKAFACGSGLIGSVDGGAAGRATSFPHEEQNRTSSVVNAVPQFEQKAANAYTRLFVPLAACTTDKIIDAPDGPPSTSVR